MEKILYIIYKIVQIILFFIGTIFLSNTFNNRLIIIIGVSMYTFLAYNAYEYKNKINKEYYVEKELYNELYKEYIKNKDNKECKG